MKKRWNLRSRLEFSWQRLLRSEDTRISRDFVTYAGASLSSAANKLPVVWTAHLPRLWSWKVKNCTEPLRPMFWEERGIPCLWIARLLKSFLFISSCCCLLWWTKMTFSRICWPRSPLIFHGHLVDHPRRSSVKMWPDPLSASTTPVLGQIGGMDWTEEERNLLWIQSRFQRPIISAHIDSRKDQYALRGCTNPIQEHCVWNIIRASPSIIDICPSVNPSIKHVLSTTLHQSTAQNLASRQVCCEQNLTRSFHDSSSRYQFTMHRFITL